MYRNVASHLSRAFRVRSYNRVPARFASSSSVASSTVAAHQSSPLPPPPDFPFPGITLPPPLPDYVGPIQTLVTTLPNGARVASEAFPSPVASVGLYVDCGSIDETPSTSGATRMLKLMAFTDITNRTGSRVDRELEEIDANVKVSVSREQMAYTLVALKTHFPLMVELLLDCGTKPWFDEWRIKAKLPLMKAEIREASKNPQDLLLDKIHSAGFSGALGNPLLISASAVYGLVDPVMEEFVAENYTAPRIVLAASGVEHEELLSIAEPMLSDLPNVPRPVEPKSVYTGGDYRCQSETGTTHFALAFELPGGWHELKDAMVLTVLQMLLEGGGSFSAGGPGKGRYSRQCLRVRNKYPQIQSISAFHNNYNNTGIFGIQVTTGSDFVSQAIDIAANELLAVATSGQVDQEQLDRVKAATKHALLMNLESRMGVLEDIGRQILIYGERKPVEDFLMAVDEVTLKDIASISQKLISSPLTMASCGDVRYVPSYESVSSKFHSK